MKTFAELNKHDFFLLQGDCGIVEMVKIDSIRGLCITSCNGTYQKGTAYCIQLDQKVIKTNK